VAGERRARRPESEKARVSRGPDGRGERPARRLGIPASLSFAPTGPRWSFAPSGPSWPDGLRYSQLPAGRAGKCRCGPHRPTGPHRTTGPHRATEVLRGGSPGRSSRRGWRAEGPKARERESSSEPRPEAEANVRRDGLGSPRACLSRRAGLAGLSRRAGHPGPAACGTAGFLPAGPVAALVFRADRAILARRLALQPASCRPGRLQRNRPTPVRAAPAYWAAPGYGGSAREEPGPLEPAWLASGGPGGPRARKLE